MLLKEKTFAGFVAVIGLTVCSVAFASPFEEGPFKHRKVEHHRIIEDLNLTPNQEKQFNNLMQVKHDKIQMLIKNQHDKTEKELAVILTKAQMEKFLVLKEKRKKHHPRFDK